MFIMSWCYQLYNYIATGEILAQLDEILSLVNSLTILVITLATVIRDLILYA